MKIALIANNGKFVTAENGGNLKDNAIFANRDYTDISQIGPWEEFEIIQNDNGSFSIKTCNGFFWTAEESGGYGLSSNRKEAWAWEEFTYQQVDDDHSALRCKDGIHYISAREDEGGLLNCVSSAINAWEIFTILWLDKLPVNPDKFTEE